MQETMYLDNNGNEQRLIEFFETQQGENESIFEKMNRRLFELEERGHSLVSQKPVSLSDRLAYERAKKAKKKLARLQKAGA